ncbi:MAG: hypothetical protein U0414_19570 [Polyangiaceae bacterium]
MESTRSIQSPKQGFSAGAAICYDLWLRFRDASSEVEAEEVIGLLVACTLAPAHAEEALWLADVLTQTAFSQRPGRVESTILLLTKAANVLSDRVPAAEVTAREFLATSLVKAGRIDDALAAYRRAVDLSYVCGPIETRLLDLPRICSLMRKLGRFADLADVAKELHREAQTAGRRTSVLVAYEYLGEALEGLGDWAEVLALAELERPIALEGSGPNTTMLLDAIEQRVARARAALGA